VRLPTSWDPIRERKRRTGAQQMLYNMTARGASTQQGDSYSILVKLDKHRIHICIAQRCILLHTYSVRFGETTRKSAISDACKGQRYNKILVDHLHWKPDPGCPGHHIHYAFARPLIWWPPDGKGILSFGGLRYLCHILCNLRLESSVNCQPPR